MKVGDLVRKKNGLSGIGLLIDDDADSTFNDKKIFRCIIVYWGFGKRPIDKYWFDDFEVVSDD